MIRTGHLVTWPDINDINFAKVLKTTLATEQGHLDQERKNLRSTKPIVLCNDDDFYPPDGHGQRTFEYASVVLPFIPKSTTYMDLTGHFPHRSSRGNEYIYVMHDYDSNAILVLPIRNHQAKILTLAWETLHERLTKHGHPTTHFITDNEVSNELKAALSKYNKTYKLTPPHTGHTHI